MDMKKQTGDHMKETVLLYGFKDQERLKKVKRALLPLGLRMRTVGPEEYFQPVGYLAGVKEDVYKRQLYTCGDGCLAFQG